MSVKREGSEMGKRVVARAVVDFIEPGMVVGFGTGSTVRFFLEELSEREVDVVGVCTSFSTESVARDLGLSVRPLGSVGSIDLAVDGADQVDGDGNLIKGGGAAHFREKVVASLADRFICIVDDTKTSSVLDLPVPIEVAPFALEYVLDELEVLSGDPVVRECEEKDGPLVTDNGNFIVDCSFGEILDPFELSQKLSDISGAIEHGLFPGIANEILVGGKEGVTKL
ncbi:ribose-5-phosphate isomerase RpiA [Methanonatronarchaeum sp. AMET-Sl]|uniref:ribose-5-phosphate isomerase RpiA n=1 Tax=Methanonatronarchaeum sp. AMET-Sl TaxID=3037654 RepID=UPI00244DB53A|nr:ribose-5-phosphate isomerase RpiA [Methanonatronarchaeum sp. AMET-Sl]WGI17719.1 ribose-5-phosphate isomerase RpiA [Methanonatronarchaeum sp. AMET-Sl]